MYRYAIAFAVSMLTFAAISSVRAEEARVSYPFMAGVLHEQGVDMVFYIDPSDAFVSDPRADYDVYATFLEADGTWSRQHITLADGELADVVLESGQASYQFWRAGHRVYGAVIGDQTVATAVAQPAQ